MTAARFMDVSVCRALCVIHAMCTGSKRFAKVLEGKGGGFFSEGQEVGSLYELQLDEGDEQVSLPLFSVPFSHECRCFHHVYVPRRL